MRLRFAPTYLARVIEVLDENDTTHIIIYGEQGAGKTSYALWTLFSLFRSWDKALKHLVFTNDEFQLLLDEYKDTVIDAIVLDDAGTHLSKRTWWRADITSFEKWMNIVRGRVKSLIFTTPFNDIPSFIVSKIPREVLVYKTPNKIGGIPISQARIYKKIPIVGFREIRKLLHIQFFTRYYPKRVYEKYMERRREITRSLEERAKKTARIREGTEKCLIQLQTASRILGISRHTIARYYDKVVNIVWHKKRFFTLDALLEIADDLGISRDKVIERAIEFGYNLEDLKRGDEVVREIESETE